MEWNPSQQEVLNEAASQLVIGGPGTGKTALLLAIAHKALTAPTPQTVAWAAFSFRGLANLNLRIQKDMPEISQSLQRGAIVTFAQAQLQQVPLAKNKPHPAFATNNQVRQILRAIMAAHSFKGTVQEADHIIRSYKSRAKKVPESEPHYPLYRAYQSELETRNLADRHDLVRQHLLAIRAETGKPLPVDIMLVDNVQDATEIQLLWLRAHLSAGTRLVMAGDDDITAFGRDGAQGMAGLKDIQSWPEVIPQTLKTSYRTPPAIAPVISKIPRMLKERLDKPSDNQSKNLGTLHFHVFSTQAEETAWLVNAAHAHKDNPRAHVGLIMRDDFTGNLIAQQLRKTGFNPASYARPMWEEPAAQTTLALLYVLLGVADEKQIGKTLAGFGIPFLTVKELQKTGIVAKDWLASGAPLPQLTTLPAAHAVQLAKVQSTLVQAYQVFQSKKLDPRTVFKGLLDQLLKNLPEADHMYALLAADVLLSLSGKLVDVLPRVVAESMPDASSQFVVAPVREVRNHSFNTLYLPRFDAKHWPKTNYPVIGQDLEHERRLIYLALTRSAGDIHISYTGQPSPYVAELQASLANLAKKKA